MSVPTGAGNYPPGVTDNDQHFDGEEEPEYDDDEWACTHCGGDGMQENDDPLWHGFDKAEIPCECCAGTGLRKHQTVF